MKKFIKYSILFILPITLTLITLEILVHTIPNSYSYKYNYVKTRGNNIRALAIGHSQFYDDFKSDSFFLPAFNLSNSAQGYMENYFLLKELLPSMPNLEMVLMPIGYMTVGREEMFTQKSCFYHEYMNIDYDGNIPLQYRFECFQFKSSVKKIFSYYLKHEDIVRCDSLGWSPHYFKDRKHELGHDRLIDIYTLEKGSPFFLAGEKYLNRIIEMLDEIVSSLYWLVLLTIGIVMTEQIWNRKPGLIDISTNFVRSILQLGILIWSPIPCLSIRTFTMSHIYLK